MTGNNPNPDIVNINAYIKFDENLSICSQDIELKWNYDRLRQQMEWQTTQILYSPPPLFFNVGL